MDTEKPAFCASLPAIFTVGNKTKGQVLQLPHRHAEATGKPDTREETGGRTKTRISCETSSNFHTFQLQVFLRTRKLATSKSMFRARLPSIHACHRICTLSPLDAALPTRCAKNTQRDTFKVLRPPRKMTMDTPKVLRLPGKLQHIF